MPIYIGIDPGQKGGIALIENKTICTKQMPITLQDIYYAIRSQIEPVNIDAVAMLELVHSMPGQGVASSFKFGRGYGQLEMALTALGIPFEYVNPRTWQKALGITPRKKTESKTEFKNRLKAKAQQLFPKVNVTLATADALLIALYCQRKHEGTLTR